MSVRTKDVLGAVSFDRLREWVLARLEEMIEDGGRSCILSDDYLYLHADEMSRELWQMEWKK